MTYIQINRLTKDYGQGRGIFDVNLSIAQGESIGFVGVNGAGKTTTIRHLMGFIKPDDGQVIINGLDAYQSSAEIKRSVAYIPGEINFPGNTTGEKFLKEQLHLMGRGNIETVQKLSKLFQLDTSVNIRSMSKGMKQKTAIVAALAADADILIMDEPTTGLDPLMRDIFLELLKDEKDKGKTLFMSSHIFQEVEEVSDRVIVIQEGQLTDEIDMKSIRYNVNKTYQLAFEQLADYQAFINLDYQTKGKNPTALQVIIQVNDADINQLINDLKEFKLKSFKEIKVHLEEFMKLSTKEKI